MGNYDFAATYESLECDEFHHYAYPSPLLPDTNSPSPPDANSSSYNNYTYITVATPTKDRRTSKNYVYTMDEDLYHAIGPNAGLPLGLSSKLADPSSSTTLVRSGLDEVPAFAGGFYHVLDSATAMEIPAAQYEDPTSSKSRVCFTISFCYVGVLFNNCRCYE